MENRGNIFVWFIGGVILLVLILVIIPWLTGFRTVNAGEVAVVREFGKVTGRTLDPGAHFVKPFIEDTVTYNTKQVTYETAVEEKQKNSEADFKDFPVNTNTKDGQPVNIQYTIRFSTDPSKAIWVAQNIGTEQALVEKIVKTESRIWVRNIPRKYTALELYTGDSVIKVQDEIFKQLEPTFKRNGLRLDTIGVREIEFDQGYVNAIKQKQVEEVNIAVQTNKALAEVQVKNRRITAAEAAAQEQNLQKETLTPELLQKYQLDVQLRQIEVLEKKWNGQYPQYYLGGGQDLGNLILPLPGSR